VTVASALVFDFDGITDAALEAIRKALKPFSFLMYTSHSHRAQDKPGNRLRLLLAVDERLDLASYGKVHEVVNRVLLAGSADPSGRSLAQQQSLWMAHPSRASLAWKAFGHGAVLSARACLSLAPANAPRESTACVSVIPSTILVARIREALAQINADRYDIWMRTLVCLKALAPVVGLLVARQLAVSFSETGSEEARGGNADARYNPAVMFDNLAPTMTADAAPGVLYGLARACACKSVNADRGKQQWCEAGHRAAEYLAKYHRRAWEDLKAGRAVA
jgi:hypothetical protein